MNTHMYTYYLDINVDQDTYPAFEFRIIFCITNVDSLHKN